MGGVEFEVIFAGVFEGILEDVFAGVFKGTITPISGVYYVC
jgi:hypothetical protein